MKNDNSVPYSLVKKNLQVRYNGRIVEIFYKTQRIASHIRSYVANGYTTDTLHMPKHHQHQTEWTLERIVSWATTIGPETSRLVKTILTSRLHPQQGFRPCVGIIRLAKTYGKERLEAACKRALSIGTHSYKSIDSILKNKLEDTSLPAGSSEQAIPEFHENVRGHDYFQ